MTKLEQLRSHRACPRVTPDLFCILHSALSLHLEGVGD